MNILSELQPFFHPRSIAVVGVSADSWKFGSFLFSVLRQFDRSIPVYPVSNRITEFMGLKVYQSISELPEGVELGFVCLPPPLVAGIVRECAARGIPAVVVPGGGFRESGTPEGNKLEAELGGLAGSGMRIIGPNCFGVYSPAGGVTIIPGGDFSRTVGSVSFLAQSGSITEDFCGLARDYRFYIKQAVSYGNGCDVNEVDLSAYFLADGGTEIVAAYIEGVRAGRSFFEAVKNLAAAKPTIIWKGGLTPGGAKAAASHTGSLAGSDAAWNAFFKQTGAIQARSMEELLDTVSALYHLPASRDDTVAVICGGGGAGVAASDACYQAGLAMAAFEEPTRQKLQAVLPSSGSGPGSPLDCNNPFPKSSTLADILEIIAGSGKAGSIIMDKIAMSVTLRQLLGYDKQVGWQDEPWLEEIPVHIRNKYKIPVVVVLREGGEPLEKLACESERRRLRKYYQENGVAVYPTIQRAAGALGKMVRHSRRMGQENER